MSRGRNPGSPAAVIADFIFIGHNAFPAGWFSGQGAGCGFRATTCRRELTTPDTVTQQRTAGGRDGKQAECHELGKQQQDTQARGSRQCRAQLQ